MAFAQAPPMWKSPMRVFGDCGNPGQRMGGSYEQGVTSYALIKSLAVAIGVQTDKGVICIVVIH
jgi:hypothetical protein